MSFVEGGKIPVAVTSDPRTHFPDWAIPAKQSAQGISYLKASATSTGTEIAFDGITPPSPATSVLGRDMLWHTTLQIEVKGAAVAGGNFINLGSDTAPRAMPFNSVANTITLTLNNQSFTVSQWDQIGAPLMKFNPRGNTFKYGSLCPWMPDNCAKYSEMTGSLRDVIAASASNDHDTPRGGYTLIKSENIPGTPAAEGSRITLEVFEPVNISPLLYGLSAKESGLPYIQTFSLRFVLGDLKRLLSRKEDANAITSFNVVPESMKSLLYYQVIAAPLLDRSLPEVISMPFHRIQTSTAKGTVHSFTPAAFANPAGSNMVSNVIQYPCIPSRIYVFAAPAVKTETVPDYTLRYCGGLNVQWNGDTGLMTSILPRQLWAQAVEAGAFLSWEDFDGQFRLTSGAATGFVGGVGSILCLRPGTDFPLQAGLVPGQAGSYQFQVSANFANQAGGRAIPAYLYVVAVLPGVVSFTRGYEVTTAVGVISQEDVLAARETKVAPEHVYDAEGGGLFDSLKSAIRRVADDPVGALMTAGKYAHKGLSMASKAGLLGEGAVSGGATMFGGSALSGGMAFGGSALSGGARLSKRDLAARLR